MVPSRAPHHWRLFLFFAGIDLVDFVATYQAHRHYVAGPGQPTAMPLGQLLGWASSICLLIALLIAAVSYFRNRALPSYRSTVPPRQ